MQNILDFSNILEITRAQIQYGYALAGGNQRISNLSEHQYLVTMIGWQLADYANKKGGSIDTLKVIKMCLIHDLGELFGGDIGMYYARANKEAYKLAKSFEDENQRFLSKYFCNQDDAKYFDNSTTDEAQIAKLADYIEVTHYKLFNNQFQSDDLNLVKPKIKSKIDLIENEKTREAMNEYVDFWIQEMSKNTSFLSSIVKAIES